MDAADALRIPEQAALITALQNNAGRRKFCRMSQGQRDCGKTHPFCNLFRSPVEPQAGPSARLPNHFELQPVHPVADPRSQGLRSGLFGGKSGGKALCCVALAQAIGLFRLGINPVQKAASISVNGAPYAANLDKINSRSNDHVVYQTTTFPAPCGHLLDLRLALCLYLRHKASVSSAAQIHLGGVLLPPLHGPLCQRWSPSVQLLNTVDIALFLSDK